MVGAVQRKKGFAASISTRALARRALDRRESCSRGPTRGTMRTWKAANPPRDAGRRRALGKPMSNSSFLGLLFCVILSCFAKGAWAVTVVAGGEHTCAILNDGSVKCWGRNHQGQLASGDYTDRSIPTPTDLLPRPVVKLALGHQHTCVVLDDGTARCWGDNFYGQLGNGEDGVADRVPQTPQGFGSTGSVTDIACGEEFTCAIRTDGTVECWGIGGSGQIGHGAFSGITTPYPTSPTISAIDIALGGMAACALLQDGSVKCWGNNDYGQLGIGSYGGSSYFSPQTQSSGALGGKATSIFMSWYPGTNYDHVCATMENGDVMCWGWNSNDILGLGNGDNPAAISSPTISPSMSSVTQDVTMGGEHTCIVYNIGGGVGCFGDNYYGQFAGTSPYAWSPIGSSAANISTGYRHTCAVMDDDSVYCWGANGNGQLGTGNSLTQSEPTLIMCGTNKYAGSTSCTNCPSGKVNPAGDAVYGSGTGTCALAPSPPPAPPSEPECAAPTSHSLLTDSCATCFAGFYTSNSSVYYDCVMNLIYYFSPEYVTFDGSQPTWNGGAYLIHNYGRDDPAGDWLYSSTWITLRARRSMGSIAAQATYQMDWCHQISPASTRRWCTTRTSTAARGSTHRAAATTARTSGSWITSARQTVPAHRHHLHRYRNQRQPHRYHHLPPPRLRRRRRRPRATPSSPTSPTRG